MGVHISRDVVRVGMFDTRGHYLHFWQEDTGDCQPLTIAQKIRAGINHLVDYRKAKPEEVSGVGVTLDGKIDFFSGVVLEAPALKWRNVPFKAQLAEILNKPVFLDDDLNCIALAEAWQGAGWGKKNLLLIAGVEQPGIRFIEDRKPMRDKGFLNLNDTGQADGFSLPDDILPLLDRLVTGISPEVIAFSGLRPQYDQEFWAHVNHLWQSHAVREGPSLLPVELGEEAPLIGSAGIVIFREVML